MSKAPKDLRIPVMMSAADVEAIDSWRFANRIATRAEAIRRLCQVGLFSDATRFTLIEGINSSETEVSETIAASALRLNIGIMLMTWGDNSDGGKVIFSSDIEKIMKSIKTPKDLKDFLRQVLEFMDNDREKILTIKNVETNENVVVFSKG